MTVDHSSRQADQLSFKSARSHVTTNWCRAVSSAGWWQQFQNSFSASIPGFERRSAIRRCSLLREKYVCKLVSVCRELVAVLTYSREFCAAVCTLPVGSSFQLLSYHWTIPFNWYPIRCIFPPEPYFKRNLSCLSERFWMQMNLVFAAMRPTSLWDDLQGCNSTEGDAPQFTKLNQSVAPWKCIPQ